MFLYIIEAYYEAKTFTEIDKQLRTYFVDLLLIKQSLIADITQLPQNRFVVLADELDTRMLLAASQQNACGDLLRENASGSLLKMTISHPKWV